ncbi:DEAD-box ATP-dependent RNA helicase 42-like [Pyrus ussuriensis x Pyrus communis]|uniref:DEAD-box ATP-dependent RNA helicase 42-like n=1 Tax=Pyrus ussuriensis x Pyrus communis TaxID=2448454 RepID=A0A5N5I346_9ROSA|nr:DEAD-box ATP-dependent RNA helicase 42-like [Pyrus ussuriensis x Pyrus communis]
MEIESKLKIIHLAKLLPLQKKSVKGNKAFFALSVRAHLGAFRLVLTFAILTKLQLLGGASKGVAIAANKSICPNPNCVFPLFHELFCVNQGNIVVVGGTAVVEEWKRISGFRDGDGEKERNGEKRHCRGKDRDKRDCDCSCSVRDKFCDYCEEREARCRVAALRR